MTHFSIDQVVGWIGLLLAAAGIVSFIIGYRGKRTDDHPLCRKCGYDLTGRPETSTRCAECGSDLSHRRAVTFGHRLRRKRWLRVGMVMLLLGFSGAGWTGYRIASTIDYVQYLPLSWLAKDVDKGTLQARQRAYAEIVRRTDNHLLSYSQTAWMMDHVFDLNDNVASPLVAEWDLLILKWMDDGRLSNERNERYLKQLQAKIAASISNSHVVGPILHRGQSLRFRMNIPTIVTTMPSILQFPNARPLFAAPQTIAPSSPLQPRTSSIAPNGAIALPRVATTMPVPPTVPPGGVRSAFPISIQCSAEDICIDGRMFAAVPRFQADIAQVNSVEPDWKSISDLPDGMHDLTVQVHVEMYAGTMYANISARPSRMTFDFTAKRPVRITGEPLTTEQPADSLPVTIPKP